MTSSPSVFEFYFRSPVGEYASFVVTGAEDNSGRSEPIMLLARVYLGNECRESQIYIPRQGNVYTSFLSWKDRKLPEWKSTNKAHLEYSVGADKMGVKISIVATNIGQA